MKIHLDIDCYFVSAERTRYPFLLGKNVVVAKGSDKQIFSKKKKNGVILQDTGAFNGILNFSSSKTTEDILNNWKSEFIENDGSIRAIVIAKSYECKKYRIETGTSVKDALCLCPDLKILKSDHLFYQKLSQKLKKYLETKIPIIQQYSIDEFFGDLDGWIEDKDTFDFIKNLQQDILEKFNLPITIAASKSKWIAKLLTDKIKPFGVLVLEEKDVLEYTKNISVSEFPGIGKAISKSLKQHEIKTLNELRQRPKLLNAYGKIGKDLYRRICGIDNEDVKTNTDKKCIGIGRNFKPIFSRDELLRRTTILARYLSHTILKLNLNPTSFYFKIIYQYGQESKLNITKDRLFNEEFLVVLSRKVILKLDINKSQQIKYIGISVSNFSNSKNSKTFSLLSHEKDMKFLSLDKKLLKIRDKYGIDSIRYANEL